MQNGNVLRPLKCYNLINRHGRTNMRKSSYIACPIEECRNRLGNVGIGYSDLGGNVYRFNSVKKKGEEFSFYAQATLTPSGEEGTDLSLELIPDGVIGEPENVAEIYDKFFARFFRLVSQPSTDPFADVEGATRSYATGGETKFCVHCGAVIDKKAVVCPKCGCSQKRDYMQDKTSAVGIAAIIFAILGGWLGIALAVAGLLFYYKDDSPVDEKGRKNCKIAVGIFIGWIVLGVLIFLISLGATVLFA